MIKNKVCLLIGIIFIVLCIVSFSKVQNIWMIIPGFVCGALFIYFSLQLNQKVK